MRKLDYPKHPDFDAVWRGTEGGRGIERLAYKMAHKIAKKCKTRADELIGGLVLVANALLYRYREGRGTKFSTFFCKYCKSYLRESAGGFDSERVRTAMAYRRSKRKRRAVRLGGLDLEAPARPYVTETAEVLSWFGDFWAEVLAPLSERERQVLLWRYKEGLTGREMGARLQTSKTTVEVAAARALAKVRAHLAGRREFRRLLREGISS